MVRLLRRRGLTSAVIRVIFDRANVFAAYVQETNDILDGYAPMDEAYLRLRLPTPVVSTTLTTSPLPSALTFECVSRDLGGVADTHQSPVRCHRWLEFEILDAHQRVIQPRQDVCRMFRSCRDYRCHVLTVDDPQVLKHLLPGHSVVLHVRTDKKGSSNYVKYAGISLHFAVTLSGDVDDDQVQRNREMTLPVVVSTAATRNYDLEKPAATNAPSSCAVENPMTTVSAADVTTIEAASKDTWETVESPVKPLMPLSTTEEWVDVTQPRTVKPPKEGATVAPSPHEAGQASNNTTKHPDEKCAVS
ncbi:hypothetical protein DYB25_010186 [Aphanomyces astaci]|uniref:Uncharacterized protein n=1 Tax=Aphanomyces astaci TaxID=112090 RepID=A0A397BIB9_APHAT|nr:hypothetical protein DYB25_010186 [Aphanomyces astaci]